MRQGRRHLPTHEIASKRCSSPNAIRAEANTVMRGSVGTVCVAATPFCRDHEVPTNHEVAKWAKQSRSQQENTIMKGVVLAGGTGSRLYSLSKITNKHLLPVYDKPMIFYPIQTLVNAGIEEIMIVTGGERAGDFLRLLGNGAEFGLKHLDYTYQEGVGGIAQAVSLTEHFAGGGKLVLMLGDNVIQGNIIKAVESFRRQEDGAKIMLAEVENPESYGVPEFQNGTVVQIEEKPKVAKSQYAVTGMYMYDNKVFNIIGDLKPSQRGELEITDVNNAYIEMGQMTYEILEGWWGDAGESIDALLKVNNLVARDGANKIVDSSQYTGKGERQ